MLPLKSWAISMAKTLWRYVGITAFWLSWPVLFVRLRRTSRVRIALLCQGKVLLVRNWYNSGQWQLPGGGIRDDETAIQAAKREIAEEVGIQLSLDELVPLGEQYRVAERGLSFNCQAFMADVSTTAFTCKRHEIVDGCWRHLSTSLTNISESTEHALRLVEKST